MKRSLCINRSALVFAMGSLGATAASAVEILDGERRDTTLTFSGDVVSAGFGGSDSWFGQSSSFLGEDTDSWGEFGFEPKLKLETPLKKGTFVAEWSSVFTKTYDDDASGLTIGLDDTEDFTVEQANIGWKAADLFEGLEDDEFSIAIGRQDYTIGTGMIVNDGGGDGAERGGWYLGMRKAFDESLLVRLDTKRWLVEGFHIENRPRAGGIEGEADGVNVEYTLAEAVTLGGSYLDVQANLPDEDSLDVFSGRIDWGGERNIHASGEYVSESNDQIDSAGWYGEVGYTFAAAAWAPDISFRYAHFDGDVPDTADDEQFREIAYGFTDYGTWYQGEIAGNYPLGNGNVVSRLLRAQFKPREKLSMNILYYNFMLDEPASLDSGVTADDFGDELDITFDWQATDNIYIIGVIGALSPGEAAKQWTGGEDDWIYSMFYVTYSW